MSNSYRIPSRDGSRETVRQLACYMAIVILIINDY